MSNLTVSTQIAINTEYGKPVYQRDSDSFFSLSQAYLDLGRSPNSFLEVPAVSILFLRYGKRKPESTRMTITSLIKSYPHLIYYDRSSRKIESGVWLHSLFLPSFEQWAKEVKGKNWDRQPLEIGRFERIYQVPTSHYQFKKISLVEKTNDVWIREADGFVRIDSLKKVKSDKFVKMFKEKSFLTTLEAIREKLNLELDYSILNDQSMYYSERVYRLYKPLYDRQLIEEVDTFWLHPKLALMLDNDYNTKTAINDWQHRRRSPKDLCYVTQVGSPEAQKRQDNELSIFRVPECNVSIYDAPDLIVFKITEAESQWQFLLCPVSFEIIISMGLLCRWGLKKVVSDNHIDRPYKYDYCSAMAEIERAKKANKTIERLLERNDIISLKHFDLDLWGSETIGTLKFTFEDAEYVATVPGSIATAMKYTSHAAKNNFIYTGSLEHTRIQLEEIGYKSPLLVKQPSPQPEAHFIASFNFKGHTISYRLSDGFVDANSLCKLKNRNLDKWLKSEQTWKLFEERARQLGKKSIFAKKGNSVFTRVSASFPYLIERKRGSKANGGGTWLDADLGIQLLAWIDAKFALELGRTFKEKIQNKNQPLP